QDLGWTDSQNTRIDYRWPGGDIEQIQSLAKELVGSRPDVLVGIGPAPAAALQQVTRTIPIVFLMSVDPVAAGIVESLARPGGNATGSFATEPSAGGKWLELLKRSCPVFGGLRSFLTRKLAQAAHCICIRSRQLRPCSRSRLDRRPGSPFGYSSCNDAVLCWWCARLRCMPVTYAAC